MTQLTPLDSKQIHDWLTRVTQTIDRNLHDPVRTDYTVALRAGIATKVGLPMLTQMALLSDCLRVAHLAVEADGTLDPDEIARVTALVRLAAPKFFQLLPHYEEQADIETPADVSRFLAIHRADAGPFGFGDPKPWKGLDLARAVQAATRNATPVREHESMLVRVMDEVFAGKQGEVERNARRELRAMFETTAPTGADPRALAFCRNDGPEVFSSVAHGSDVHTRDPFDVGAIHADARHAFQQALERACLPAQNAGRGRTLLLLGDSGAGKTHLLRAFRAQAHGQRLGYVGYLQMASDVVDYPRYILRNLVDSLEQPYDAPAARLSGLNYLSDGLVAGGRVEIPAGELESLRTAELSSTELDRVVGRLIDRIIRTDGLQSLDPDLVHALLLLQRHDNAIAKRVVKYLRCESLGAHDRELLGGLASRERADDPLRMLKQLGAVMYELQMASLVLLVDQLEDINPAGAQLARMQVAFDSLRAVADAVPSAVVVIACLNDVYTAVRSKLTQSLVDRLEQDPPAERLATQRDRQEIESMLALRLEHLYTTLEAPYREDEPIYPFSGAQVDAVRHQRARDVLAHFRDFQRRCIDAGRVIGAVAPEPTLAAAAPPPPPPPAPDLDRAWNDALSASIELPDSDDEVLALIADGLAAAVHELGLPVEVGRAKGKSDHVALFGPQLARRVLAVCNRNAQGGHLNKQLDALRGVAGAGTTAIALRTSDWSGFAPKSAINKQIGTFVAAGGRTIRVAERDLRAVLAIGRMSETPPQGFDAWRRSTRPMAKLGFVRDVLDLDSGAPGPALSAPPPPSAPPARPTPSAQQTAPLPKLGPGEIRLGTTQTMKRDPVTLLLEHVKNHVAFLGTTGSGKTTAALNVVEQLLEAGISIVMVDRKGDLSSYAREAWWREGDPRRTALRGRIAIDLFTPGNAAGRALRLPLVPSMREADRSEREQLAKLSASSLGTMMGYGRSASHNYKLSILQCAILLHADDPEVSLDALADTISRPDPELLSSVGGLQRLFPQLSEDLQSLKIQRGSLIAGTGDALDVAAMLPPPGTAAARLTIINTAAIAEIPVLEFWMSRLLIDLGRLARKRPAKSLQGAVLVDEAEAYIPAVREPPTKAPMFELLRRARAAGFGMLLSTQNPGDFDYKARDLINTWLVGKIGSETAVQKMKTLLGSYPNVATRLATQPVGHFFALREGGSVVELKSDSSMMRTEQLGEHEIASLARAGLPA